MNIGPLLNIDPVSMIKQFAGEVRQSRLFPIVVGLGVALVAIPVLLTSSASSIPTVPLKPLPVAAPPWTSVPALSVEPLAGQGRLSGASRDPFKQQASAAAPSTTSGATGRPAAATALAGKPGAGATSKLGTSSGAPSLGSHGGSGGSSPSVSTPPVQALTPTPPASLPSTPPAPSPPSGVGPKQSLAVAVAMSDPSRKSRT